MPALTQSTADVDGHNSRGRRYAWIAGVCGILGAILTGIAPLLPVTQQTATLAWPQLTAQSSTANVTASLVAQSPQELHVLIPCGLLRQVAANPPAEGASAAAPRTAFATISQKSTTQVGLGLVVAVRGNTVAVSSRNTPIVSADLTTLPACQLRIDSTQTGVTATFAGANIAGDTDTVNRPVIAGMYTDLTPAQVRAAGPALNATAIIDTRFETSPSAIKLLAIILGVALVLAALIALAMLDRIHGYVRSVGRRRRVSFTGLRPRWVDVAAIGVLVVWNFLGAGSSDDGYLLTMARASESAGYTPNYYRFFGAPDAPFDWYQNFLSVWAQVSTAGIWMRVPAVAAGIIAWLLLSRILLPRLGPGVRRFPASQWAAATILLAFWLPMCSGLRVEPIIAVLLLCTWAAVEKTVGTRRLFPAALALLFVGLSVAAAPQGIVALGLLVTSAGAITRVIVTRRSEAGVLAIAGPLVGVLGLIIAIVFRDQSLASVAEAIRIRLEVGPATSWTLEYLRYYYLTVKTPDGALVRRVPILLLVMCSLVVMFVMLRRGRIVRVDPSPVWRVLGAVLIAPLLLTMTPTKWTIHLGVLAGLAAAIAAVAVVAVTEAARTSIRNFTFFLCGTVFCLAASFAGYNDWPWPFAWGIPWFDRQPQLHGITFSGLLLILAGLLGAVAAWQHFRSDFTDGGGLADDGAVSEKRKSRRLQFASIPIPLIAGVLVIGEVLVFCKAAYSEHPAFSVVSANLAAAAGSPCAMANKVLVETDPSANFLTPVDGKTQSEALRGSKPRGFTPDGVAEDLSPLATTSAPGRINVASPVDIPFASSATTSGTGGGTGPRTVNGSTVALPYGLDATRTPVLGSYGQNTATAELITDWYSLPARSADRPLVVLSAAGSIRSHDRTGAFVYGQQVMLEWAQRRADGSIAAQGEIEPTDIGPNIPWRNLRIPTSAIPGNANVIRVHALDQNLGDKQWVAITPPRVPQLRTLQQVVGSDDPVLLDLLVGQQFPCQRPMAITHGLWELPKWRVLPSREEAIASSRTWQATVAGGPLTVPDTLLYTTTLPTFMSDDWSLDWGDLQQYRPISAAPDATVTTRDARRMGWWRPGPIRAITDQTVYSGR